MRHEDLVPPILYLYTHYVLYELLIQLLLPAATAELQPPNSAGGGGKVHDASLDKLAAMAAEQGMALPDYLRHLLEEQVPPHGTVPLSPADRARVWRDSAKGMPHTPPLSDEAVSRESFYDARG